MERGLFSDFPNYLDHHSQRTALAKKKKNIACMNSWCSFFADKIFQGKCSQFSQLQLHNKKNACWI